MKSPAQILLVSLLGLAGVVAHAKLRVVATTPDLGAVASAVGGDRVDLSVLAKPTEDPHFVDAKPSFLVKLNRADVLIEGGADLEAGWLTPLIEGARNTKLQRGAPGRVFASEGIALMEVPTTLDRSQGDIHAAGNPHFMTDPVNAEIVAAHIARVLGSLDEKSAATYEANLKAFTAQLDTKLAEWRAVLAPYAGRPVVTYHNYWIYFGRRFRLPMDLYLEPKPGIPPTPAHLAEVISAMRAGNIKLIVVQPYQNRKTAETVAGHTGATVLDFPSFPGGSDTGSYIDWMDHLVKTTANAFAAQH